MPKTRQAMSSTSIRVLIFVISLSCWCVSALQPTIGSEFVVFKIYNHTTVPMTELYDKHSSRTDWGWNDLQDVGSGNPFTGKVHPLLPAHYFPIRYDENAYSHCPNTNMLLDVKAVFANGAVKIGKSINICKYDWGVDHL